MKEKAKFIFNKFRHLILYGIIGSFAAGLDFLIYTVLVQLVGIPYWVVLPQALFLTGIITLRLRIMRLVDFPYS